ncbi:hypothetical protein W97_07872 [Coniosporium apollinis CBS 100218]|uniref:MARVEL domain-containing protein n=1 Tax=Coniosporium apollinis (strain CBS 100218) TaxID=1168221 RepID=R7Z3N5_CONA1|nr:uncharacterized protein W97_07872 [Coniosporium apollinis CBS 100218]EON68614.1 hypothetical protein W97_07872 [Coniosporium apollinis CBS 100218]
MASERIKRAPTHYPFIPFHFLRSAQLFSSLVVSCIMLYFISSLKRDHYQTPWTFLFLLSVSLLTLITLTTTLVLHICSSLNPRLDLILNAGLFMAWTISFAMLAWYSGSTLTHVCNRDNWKDDMGVMVCRVYKALFGFAVLGVVSTLLALLLDLYVFRQATKRGMYNAMEDLDSKRSPTPNLEGMRSQEFLDVNDEHPLSAQRPAKAPKQSGYEMPAEQFEYDTGYYGGHAER